LIFFADCSKDFFLLELKFRDSNCRVAMIVVDREVVGESFVFLSFLVTTIIFCFLGEEVSLKLDS
jgi:hypothetical protein